MAQILSKSLFTFLSPSPALHGLTANLSIVRSWLLEVVLLWTRWSIALLLVSLLIIFPDWVGHFTILLVIILIGGNLWLSRLLRPPTQLQSLRLARPLATGLANRNSSNN